MTPIKSDKPHAVVSVYKGLHVIYTNKTLIKAKIYSSYSINEVKAGQTYIKRKRKKRKKKRKKVSLCSEKKTLITYSSCPWD